MLEYTFDTIAKYFPNYDESPFVQEKFFEDWSPDRTHMWQQNRGVVGHNLKIAWNLMRMYSLKPKPEYEALARKIAEVMPAIGGDQQRGGWYDVMEREREAGRGDLPLCLPRPQGVVAAGTGHPGLPDPERRAGRRRVPAHRPRVVGLLQRVLPGSRRRRGLLQRAGQRHRLPVGHGAVQGQPLDEHVPLGRAGLPGRRSTPTC